MVWILSNNGVAFGDAVEDPCGVCDGDGTTCAVSVSSCLEATESGVYNVGGEITFCDMDRDGGGWSLVASFVNTDGETSWVGRDGRNGLPGSLGQGLVAWWNFDEPGGSDPLLASFAQIEDASLLTAQPVNGAGMSTVPGIIGGARRFDGASCLKIDSEATRGEGVLNQNTRDFSMSLWIKGEEDHSGSHERVWSKAGGWSNANDGFGIQFNPNRWDHPYFDPHADCY